MRMCNKDKLSKLRKVNIGFHQGFMQRNWLTMIKAKHAEATKQALHLPSQLKHQPLCHSNPLGTVLYALLQEKFS